MTNQTKRSTHDGINDLRQLASRIGESIEIMLPGTTGLDQAAMAQVRAAEYSARAAAAGRYPSVDLDANYGGVLIVFDRLFGTYVAARDDLPCDFGLVSPRVSSRVISHFVTRRRH